MGPPITGKPACSLVAPPGLPRCNYRVMRIKALHNAPKRNCSEAAVTAGRQRKFKSQNRLDSDKLPIVSLIPQCDEGGRTRPRLRLRSCAVADIGDEISG